MREENELQLIRKSIHWSKVRATFENTAKALFQGHSSQVPGKDTLKKK